MKLVILRFWTLLVFFRQGLRSFFEFECNGKNKNTTSKHIPTLNSKCLKGRIPYTFIQSMASVLKVQRWKVFLVSKVVLASLCVLCHLFFPIINFKVLYVVTYHTFLHKYEKKNSLLFLLQKNLETKLITFRNKIKAINRKKMLSLKMKLNERSSWTFAMFLPPSK
jgi:hypothetical protein